VWQFIQNKYVKKLYVAKNSNDPITEFHENGFKPKIKPQQILSAPIKTQSPPMHNVSSFKIDVPPPIPHIPAPIPQRLISSTPVIPVKPNPPIQTVQTQRAKLLDFDSEPDLIQPAPVIRKTEIEIKKNINEIPMIQPKIINNVKAQEMPKKEEQTIKMNAKIIEHPENSYTANFMPQNNMNYSMPMTNLYLPYTNPMYSYPYYSQPIMNMQYQNSGPFVYQNSNATMQKIPASKLEQLKQFPNPKTLIASPSQPLKTAVGYNIKK